MDTVRLPDGAVPEMYFVDLDGTLLSASSEKYFLKHLVKKGILSPGAFLRFLSFYAFHPGRTIREGKGWNRSYLKGIPPEVVKREAEVCAGILLKNCLREWTLKSIHELKSAGCETVLLSASLEYIAFGIAEKIPFDIVRASNPEILECKFTGRLHGLRPWGRNKAELMRRICEERKIKPENCVSAGDSWGERFVMRENGFSVAVCPDRRLRRLAEKEGWRIVEGRHTRWA